MWPSACLRARSRVEPDENRGEDEQSSKLFSLHSWLYCWLRAQCRAGWASRADYFCRSADQIIQMLQMTKTVLTHSSSRLLAFGDLSTSVHSFVSAHCFAIWA